MSELFVGWDVGVWSCDKNSQKNRDALVALEVRKSQPELVGAAWRGNVRPTVSGTWSYRALRDLLDLTSVTQRESDRVTLAIGAPLAWPQATVQLLGKGKTTKVPDDPAANPYLFRRQEIDLATDVDKPISTVRDPNAGSVSTKGMHFLRAADLKAKSPGVWTSPDKVLTVIETSVGLARERYPRLAQLTKKIFEEQRNWDDSHAFESDVSDAITCALVAWLWSQEPHRLVPPDEEATKEEGWIWLPPAPKRKKTKEDADDDDEDEVDNSFLD